MNILFIAAHPDDVEVCAGGTIASHVADGDSVTVLSMFMPTNSIRFSEFNAAASKLGYEAHPLYFQDFHSHRLILSTIEERYSIENFSRIYCMNVGDSHQEHVIAANIAIAFARENRCDLLMCQPALPGGISHRPFNGNYIVNTSRFIENKKEAILQHKSQIAKYSKKHDWLEAIIARDKATGQLINCSYAEPFEVLKIVRL